jgi:hypothetical protein
MAANDDICKELSEAGGVATVLAQLEGAAAGGPPELARAAAGCLRQLANNDGIKAALAEQGALGTLVRWVHWSGGRHWGHWSGGCTGQVGTGHTGQVGASSLVGWLHFRSSRSTALGGEAAPGMEGGGWERVEGGAGHTCDINMGRRTGVRRSVWWGEAQRAEAEAAELDRRDRRRGNWYTTWGCRLAAAPPGGGGGGACGVFATVRTSAVRMP